MNSKKWFTPFDGFLIVIILILLWGACEDKSKKEEVVIEQDIEDSLGAP